MDYELNESFSINNDSLADWAIRTIKDEESERDRLIKIAEEQIADLNQQISQLQEKCENKTKFLKGHLQAYFSTVPHKETKTQETYKLLSGSLVFKKPSFKINHNDDQLITLLDGSEFVETKKSLRWGEYKKMLEITDEHNVIDKITGEIIEACSVEDVPASFDIKF